MNVTIRTGVFSKSEKSPVGMTPSVRVFSAKAKNHP